MKLATKITIEVVRVVEIPITKKTMDFIGMKVGQLGTAIIVGRIMVAVYKAMTTLLTSTSMITREVNS